MPDLYADYAAAWGVDRHDVRRAMEAEEYYAPTAFDLTRVERTAVQLYRAQKPLRRLPQAVEDGPEILTINTIKQAFDELEAEHILNIETEFCRQVGVL